MGLIVGENEQLAGQIQSLRLELQKADDDTNNMNREILFIKNENANLTREKEKYRLISEEVVNTVHKLSPKSGQHER